MASLAAGGVPRRTIGDFFGGFASGRHERGDKRDNEDISSARSASPVSSTVTSASIRGMPKKSRRVAREKEQGEQASFVIDKTELVDRLSKLHGQVVQKDKKGAAALATRLNK